MYNKYSFRNTDLLTGGISRGRFSKFKKTKLKKACKQADFSDK